MNKTDVPKCGFNKDGNSYCNKRKGDSWFQDALKSVSGVDISKVSCHAQSGLLNCKALSDAVGKTVFNKWRKEYLTTDESAGYAQVANNDKCTASAITKAFWIDTTPGFAFSSFTMTSFAAMVLAISALFYMF